MTRLSIVAQGMLANRAAIVRGRGGSLILHGCSEELRSHAKAGDRFGLNFFDRVPHVDKTV